jgi:hypothetical protein
VLWRVCNHFPTDKFCYPIGVPLTSQPAQLFPSFFAHISPFIEQFSSLFVSQGGHFSPSVTYFLLWVCWWSLRCSEGFPCKAEAQLRLNGTSSAVTDVLLTVICQRRLAASVPIPRSVF